MRLSFVRVCGVVAILGLALPGCSSDSTSSTPTTPTTPTGTATTEVYTGTLTSGAVNYHPFATTTGGAQSAPVTATLTSVAPLATLAIGMALGTWDGTTCTVVLSNDNARVNSVLTGSTTSPINLCVKMYDSGNVSTAVTYTVTVTHY